VICPKCGHENLDDTMNCAKCRINLVYALAHADEFQPSEPESPSMTLSKEAGKDVIVTTGDLRQDYEVVGPVYFQVSNKGIFFNQLSRLLRQYKDEIAERRDLGQIGRPSDDWGFLYGEWSVGQSLFEQAFFVAVQELKKRAALLKADAIISMRQDIDLDTTGFQYFYLQMYGTAVRFKED
jgi:hypothetical protein